MQQLCCCTPYMAQGYVHIGLRFHPCSTTTAAVVTPMRLGHLRCLDGDSESGAKKEKRPRQRSAKHQRKLQTLTTYRERFSTALQAELTEEMEEMKRRLRSWSKRKIEDEGFALFNLSVRFDGPLYRDKILCFYNSQGLGFLPPQNQFNQGDVVLISLKDPMQEGDNVVEGVVFERARRFLRVVVKANKCNDISTNLKWRLDLSVNRVAHDRCLSAINCFSSDVAQQHVQATPVDGATKSKLDDVFRLGEAALTIRGLIMNLEEERVFREQASESDSNVLKVASTPPSRIGGKVLGGFKGSIRGYLSDIVGELNLSQRRAIETAACQKISLWQGPPGTGKTKTSVHFIFALCKIQQGKILACADSNIAVDNLVEGLLNLGLKVVRVGQPAKVTENLRGSTVEAQVSVHPLMKKALDLKASSAGQREVAKQIKNKKRRATGAGVSKALWEEAVRLEEKAIDDVLNRADVVAATCIGAGDTILENRLFSTCIIDEATQATEPASLVPILTSGADCVLFVGDPAQLPPTVLTQEAEKKGLAVSLFEHLQECGLKPHLLDTQYRMHPEIAELPSVLFYSGLLKSQPAPEERPAPIGFEWPRIEAPLVFVDCVDGKEEATPEGKSFFNRVEALKVMNVLELVIKGNDIDGGCNGIGIITPYSAQARLLQEMLLWGKGNPNKQETMAGLEIKTVDGFQGREKEVIIVSTVRCNGEGRLGFLKDPRRMNVALTRARRGLVVVGNSKTLESDKTWASWLKEMRRKGLIFTTLSASTGERRRALN